MRRSRRRPTAKRVAAKLALVMVIVTVTVVLRPAHLCSSLLVFAADAGVVDVMSTLGIATFHHEAFGTFPKNSARAYGDNVFTNMMWLKVVSVYFTLRCGWDVLFQDADVIWWTDPLDYFKNDGHMYDAYFQDDGARSARYSPFSANTGFYYLRSNARTRMFMHDIFHSYNLISQWRSHQHALCMILIEHHSRFGLKVKMEGGCPAPRLASRGRPSSDGELELGAYLDIAGVYPQESSSTFQGSTLAFRGLPLHFECLWLVLSLKFGLLLAPI